MELRGSAAQMAAVREDADFRRVLVDATLVVDNLRLVDGYCNDGIAQEMTLYQAAVAGIPQR
jgi:hypothetical protein